MERIGTLGPTTSGWLRRVGIHSVADLKKAGVVDVYLRLEREFPERVSLNALWALQGEVMGLDGREVPAAVKARLRREVGRDE